MFRALWNRVLAWLKDAFNPIDGFVSVIHMIWMFVCGIGSGQITFSGVTRGGRRFNFRRVNLLGILLFSFLIAIIIGYYLRSSPQSVPAPIQTYTSSSSNQEIEQLKNENAGLKKDLELVSTTVANSSSANSTSPTAMVNTPCADKAELENCKETNAAILQESKELQSQLKTETARAGNLQQQLVQSPRSSSSNSSEGSDQQMQPPRRSDGLTQLQRDQAEAARKRGGG